MDDDFLILPGMNLYMNVLLSITYNVIKIASMKYNFRGITLFHTNKIIHFNSMRLIYSHRAFYRVIILQ